MKPNALIIGSNGAIGQALIVHLKQQYTVHTLTRSNCNYTPAHLKQQADNLALHGPFQKIICTIGTLQDDQARPEKSLKQINPEQLAHYYHVNAILPMLCLQSFIPLLDKKTLSVFACLSAMVGSITDNQLGGWYGYRSAKAALNMLIKTTAIELKRTNKNTSIIAIHPGTTQSNLSAPFSANVTPDKYYSPEQTAERIDTVLDNLTPKQTGSFFNWTGEIIPW